MLAPEQLDSFTAWATREQLALFPIPAWRKRPQGLVRSHKNDWSRDPLVWRDWYSRSGGCNFGVEAGPSRLIFVDLDTKDGEALPLDAYRSWDSLADVSAGVSTPSGGLHFWYRAPTSVDAEAFGQPDILRKRINVRAGAGYVLAPGCRTAHAADDSACDGAYAAHASFVSIPFATQRLLDHVSKQNQRVAASGPQQNLDLADDGLPRDQIARIEAAAKEGAALDRLRRAAPGERNIRLNEAAWRLGALVGAGKLDETRARETLSAAACDIGLVGAEEREARQTIESGLRAGLTGGELDERPSGLPALLAMAVPILAAPARIRRVADPFAEPIMERLLLEGTITTLSGGSGAGKTTLVASLIAASIAEARDFRLPTFEPGQSDVLFRPCVWAVATWEGGQYMERHRAAWHQGTGLPALAIDRVVDAEIRGPLVSSHRREAYVVAQQLAALQDAVKSARAVAAGLPVVLVVDNVMAAVDDQLDSDQAKLFMTAMRNFAEEGAAVLVLSHPPKGKSSTIYGASAYFNLTDIVGDLNVLRRDNGSWTQWVEFEKHREAPNGYCLEIKSRRLPHPIVELPEHWGVTNLAARARQIQELHLPYVHSIRVRPGGERAAAAAGVTAAPEQVEPKIEQITKIGPHV